MGFQNPNLHFRNPYEGLGDAVVSHYRAEQERLADAHRRGIAERQLGLAEKQYGLNQETQKRADRKEQYTAVDQARKLFMTDPQGAMALLKAAGIDGVTAEDLYQPNAPQGGTPMPDAMEFGRAQQGGQQLQGAMGFMGGLVQPGVQQATTPPPPLPTSQQAGNETMEPATMGKFLGQRLKFRAGDDDITFDPVEMRRAQQAQYEQTAERFKGAYGDPELDNMAARLISSGLPPEQVSKVILEEQERRRARQDKITDRADERQFMLERDQIQNAEALRRAQVLASQRGNNPAQEAAAAGAVLGGIRGDIKAFQDANSYDKVTSELNASDAALRAIESGNEKAIQNALFGYGKSTAGVGSFTAAEQDAILNRTGGTWNQISQKIGLALSGTYDPDVLRIFREAMQVKRESSLGQLKGIQSAYNDKFRQGVAYQNVMQNVADEERGMFGRWLPVEGAPEGSGGVSYGTPSKVAEQRNPKVRAYKEEQRKRAKAAQEAKVKSAVDKIMTKYGGQ